MKKIFVLLMLIAIMTLTGCNRQIIDTTYNYDKAIIKMPNDEIIEVDISKWGDYDGEQLQIVATDGTVYLVSSFNCVLYKEK